MAADVDFSQTTESILNDFISSSLREEGHQWGESSQFQCDQLKRTSRQLREMADEFANRHESSFTSMMGQLRINPDTIQSTFESVAKELFADGINWGRVIALFYFGRSMVLKMAESGALKMTNSLVRWIHDFVEKYLKTWIIQKGGWVQCIGRFAKELLQVVFPPYRIMFHILRAIALLLNVLLHTSPGAGVKMKNCVGISSKATKIILWVCGDVELNPGPGNSRSEILRKFRKSQQSSLLIILYENFGNGTVPKCLYKEVPTWWPRDIPFVNITNHKKEDESIACFDKSIEMLKQSVLDLSSDWTVILKHYNDLLRKCGDIKHQDFCKDKLLEWMGSKKIEKALHAVDTSSFMDDFRLKLKFLENLANQGETIPDDIADKISAVGRSINRSKGKRKIDAGIDDLSHLSKKQKSDSNDVSLQTQPDSSYVTVTDQLAYQPQHYSEKSRVDSVSSCRSALNHLPISPSSSAHSIDITRKDNIDNEAQENHDSVSDVVSSYVDNDGSRTDDTSSSLQLPSDLLNTILNENVENDINNFDLDLLELSDDDFSVVF